MEEQILKIVPTSNPALRVLIVRRTDGRFTFRKQWREKSGWGTVGLDAGLYDSQEMAESEARKRVQN